MNYQSKIIMMLFVLGVAFNAQEAQAQFRNHGVYLPSLGWMGFGNSTNAINSANNQKWETTDHWTLGSGYFSAIGYQLWWDNQTYLGFGQPFEMGIDKTLISLSVSSGLRYNFLRHKHRPFVNANFHYLQFFNIEGTEIKGNPNLGNTALFLGLRPGAGYEMFVGDEISLMSEVNYILFVSLDNPVRHSFASRLSFNVYF